MSPPSGASTSMFLFTSPNKPEQAQPQTQSDHPLSRPLKQAADATGISFDYLIKTAKRESNLNPEAKAANSSATGLFQFIEQTWFGLVKRQGPQLGLADAANAIQRDNSGRYTVPEPEARQQILALRKDPTLSARLAGVFTSENKSSLKEAFGREPTAGELYIAHFMGAGGARELISQASANPERSAASVFPDAASANRSIFFDGKGRARTTREVYARLVSFHDGANTAMPATSAVAAAAPAKAVTAPEEMATRSPLAIAPARNVTVTGQLRQPAQFNGFFRSGGDGQAAGELRKTWIGVAEARINKGAPSFFPRATPVQVASVDPEAVKAVAEVTSDAAPPPASTLAAFEARAPFEVVNAPLPPVRPPHLAGNGANPLDLTRYTGSRKR